MENGILSEKVIDLAAKIQGAFLVMHKNKSVNSLRTPRKPKKDKEEVKKEKRTVNNLVKFDRNKSEQKQVPKQEKKFERRTRNISELIPIDNKPGLYTWSSKDGKIKNIVIPCEFHRNKGISAEECFKQNHCWECSRSGRLAPAVTECSGNHQWKRRTPIKKK